MEFGLDQLRTGLDMFEAKYHYAILVADLVADQCSELGFGLSRPIWLASSELAALRQVCHQPRTCLRPG